MAGNILKAAQDIYGQGTGSRSGTPADKVKNPAAQYEYGQHGRLGIDTNGNGIREVDCSALVYNGLRHAGYYIPGSSAAMTTRDLFNGDKLTKTATEHFTQVADRYSDLKPGDILLFNGTNGNTSQHEAIFAGYDENKRLTFYGSQTSTGPATVTIGDHEDTFWNGQKSTLIHALRPNESLYVAAMDLSGTPGAGLSSPNVAAAVNLLKDNSVEGYRANIYSNADGVPTVGNGLTLVVKGTNGWTVLPSNQIKDLLRDAGLPESKYDELPLDKLANSASLLNAGNRAAAKNVFGAGDEGGFSVTPAEADKLSAAYIVRDVVPRVVTTLGGAENFERMATGEFAAVASKVYQSPGWLNTTNGKDFVNAWQRDDTAAAQAALGTSARSKAEADAYAGNVSTSNENLSTEASSVYAKPNSTRAAGHWEQADDANYDPLTGVQISGGPRVWIPDEAPTTSTVAGAGAGRGKVNPPSAETGSDQTAVQSNNPTVTQISPGGTTATLPNGQVIHAGPGGTLDIDVDGNLVVSRPAQGWSNADGSSSDIRQITTYDSKGAQIGTVVAQNLPGEAAPLENYAQRTVQVNHADGSTAEVNTHFQAGVGWVDDTGHTVLSLKDAQAQYETRLAHLIPGASADNDYTPGGPTGEAEATANLDKAKAQEANPDSGGGSDAEPDPQSIQGQGGTDTPSDFHAALLDAFNNPKLAPESERATNLALSMQDMQRIASDAGLPDYGLFQPGAVPAQADQAAQQLTQAAVDSAVTANADAVAVTSTAATAAATLAQTASLIVATDATGHTNIDLYLGTTRVASVPSPVQDKELAQVNAALSLVQGLNGLQHWDQMSDVSRFSSLVGLADSYNTLSGGTLGDLGNLGTAASVLNLLQAAQDGNTAGIVSGINAVSGGQIDLALNTAVNNTLGTATSGVPYVSIALALNDFDKHVGQSLGTLIGTYLGFGIGGAIGGMVGGMLDGMFGGGHRDPPPPPAGAVHFSWSESGHIQHTVDYDQSGGGTAANQAAAGVQALLESVVQAANEANAQNTGDHSNDVAINPYLLPRIHYSGSSIWMEVTQFDGSTAMEGVGHDGFAERLIGILQDNGALAPAWQVATVQGHWAQAQAELADLRAQLNDARQSESLQAAQIEQQIDARQQALDHELSAGIGGHAVAGNEAYSLQGNATESADFKTQAFGVLVVHIPQHITQSAGVQASVQALQSQALQLSEALRDVENDGYAERTDWVAATDAAGKLQGLLVLDQNSDGLIETRDILNLGGNAGQAGNATTEAALATQNAALQHNNVQWLDANGDGVLDARDPAFAAIKLWVDANQDGQMQAGEGASLTAMGLKSINFKTGEVVYANGQFDTLNAATLHANTDGARLTQVREVNPDGTLRTLDAGQVLEHEGYQGQVQVSDDGGTRWGRVREQTYEQVAKRVGDWEGTAEQEAHRHDGQSAAGAATETTAAGAISIGPVKAQPNATSDSTVNRGDGRLTSDAAVNPASVATKPNAQTVIAAGDIRIKSDSSAPAAQATPASSATSQRLAFVPSAQPSAQGDMRIVTDAMVQSAQDSVFGSGLGVLAAVGLGATAGAAEASTAAQRAVLRADAPLVDVDTSGPVIRADTAFVSLETPAHPLSTQSAFAQASVQSATSFVEIARPAVSQMPLGVATTPSPPGAKPLPGALSASAPQFVTATVVSAGADTATAEHTVSPLSNDVPSTFASASVPLVLLPPVLLEQAIAGTEDLPLVLGRAALLANAQSPNTPSNPDLPMLTITAVADAMHGRAQLVGGEVFFVPEANFHGAASFSYTVTDQYGLSSATTAYIQIAAVNDIPVTVGESTTTLEDVGLVFTAASLLANDSDVDTGTDGQTLSISAVSGASNGAAWLDADGNIRFMPDANFHGPASFSYTVSDGNGGTAFATVNITVVAVNDAPIAVGESADTFEDTTLNIAAATLLANDSDVDTATDGQVLTISAVNSPSHGTVRLLTSQDGSQQVAFTPDANFHGAASFQYTVSDGNGGTATATAIVNVLAVNDAPVAVGDLLTLQEDATLQITTAQLLVNDQDNDIATDADVLQITRVFDARHCAVELNTDNTISLRPDANYHGTVRFSYEVSDLSGATSVAFVVAGVNAVNDPPVAYADQAQAVEDQALLLEAATLLANDTDNDIATDADSLHVAAVGNAVNGTVRLTSLGQIEFVPDANFHGVAGFDYVVSDSFGATSTATVSLAVAAVNDTPVVRGETAMAEEDTLFTTTAAALLANDSDVDAASDGQTLVVARVDNAQHGVVAMDTNGKVTFTPNANFHGSASFDYLVSDGAGGFTSGTVQLQFSAVNDAPVAVGESTTTEEDTGLVFSAAALLANDSDVDTATDGQTLSISAVSGASNGAAWLDADGNIRFVPDANFHGPASFSYTVSDGNGGTASATVNITVAAVNDIPVAVGESADTFEDTTLTISAASLLANDSDVDTSTDGQLLTIGEVGNASHGAVRLITLQDGNQQVAFTPDANFHGQASFQYTVNDGNGGTASATAIVNVAAVNDAPIALGESTTTLEDVGLVFTAASLLANDSDVDTATDGQTLSISAVSGASNGAAWLDVDGNIRFVPDANFHGPASFNYMVSDGNGGTASATVSITVAAVNDIPVAVGESVDTFEDTTLTISAASLLANDSDVDTATDGQLLTIGEVGNASHGTVRLITLQDGSQQVAFKPDANFHGAASFQYTVNDGNGGAAKATAIVNVAAVNDAPIALGESTTTLEDVGLVFTAASLLANDSDVDTATDGQTLSISAVSGASNGAAWLDADGNIRFVPDANFHGPASFSYTVSDGNGGTASATVNITVAAVNDAPVAVGESADTLEDTTLNIAAATLLANDSDVDTATDGQLLIISAVSSPSHGTVRLLTLQDGSQQVAFTPDANFHGQASFQYTVNDGNGGTATATAVINYAPVNDAPVAVGESAVGDEDQRLLFAASDLLANDSDVDTATDGQTLNISRVGDAVHGSVSLDGSGNIYFTPDANYHGAASFTYWVSDGVSVTCASVRLTIAPVNDLPVAQGESVSSEEDVALLFNPATLLSNDSDVDIATDGQTLTISAMGSTSHCSVAFVTQTDGSQRISFTPEANYFGAASFQYTVSDGMGGTATAAMVVYLAQVNDVPLARNDNLAATDEDNALHISFASLLANDSDADSANAAWGGVNDVLTVVSVGEASHGAVTLSANDVLFTPDASYHGPASFAYQVRDSSGAVAQAYASFVVSAVNDAPVALGESITTNEDTTLIIQAASLLANDSDVDVATDSQVLTISAVGGATHGSVSINTDGNIVFTPDANYFGAASFTYTVSDGNGGLASATATVVLAQVNDAPVALGETIQATEDQVLRIEAAALLANDSDVDNLQTDLKISRVQSGGGATVALDAAGYVVFSPEANFNGNATFTYWVRDAAGLESNAVTATVVVAAVNDAPSAQGEIVSGAMEDTLFRIPKASLLANDHDVDDPDSALNLSWVGGASGGTVNWDGNGDVLFTPSVNFNGNASFQYTVRDATGLESSVVTAIVPVAAVNDAPTATDDQFATYRNSTMAIAFTELTSNDGDIEGDTLTVSAVRDHANGHASIVNGYVQFVPTAGFSGAASFDYLADDGHGGQTWATAFVDVTIPPNLYPTIDLSIGKTYAIWYGGTAYYAPTDIFQNFTYTINDESPGSVVMEITPLSSSLRATYVMGDPITIINGIEPSIYYSYTNEKSYPYPYSSVDSYYNNPHIFRTSLPENTFQLRQTDHTLSQYGNIPDVIKFDITLSDSDGAINVAHVTVDYNLGYPVAGGHNAYNLKLSFDHSGLFASPVVLDLNADGIHFTSIENSNIAFDANNDGIKDRMAWAGNDDGVLVWDKYHNQQISDISEFGFQQLKAGAQTDLEGLQALDSNHNGLLDGGDDKFAEFAVWQDANGNGVADAGEFLTLQDRGIASINLHSDGQMRDAGTPISGSLNGETDATVMGNAAYTRIDGSTGLVADAMLAYVPGTASTSSTSTTFTPEPPAAGQDGAVVKPNFVEVPQTVDAHATNAAELARQAALFNQFCNADPVADLAPLGFIPIDDGLQWIDHHAVAQDSAFLQPQAA